MFFFFFSQFLIVPILPPDLADSSGIDSPRRRPAFEISRESPSATRPEGETRPSLAKFERRTRKVCESGKKEEAKNISGLIRRGGREFCALSGASVERKSTCDVSRLSR